MDLKDFEICELGQDGKPFHCLVHFYHGRVCMLAGYDHEGPIQARFWGPVFFFDEAA